MNKKCGLLIGAMISLFSANLWSASVGTFSGGEGTETDPFKITKIADLQELSDNLYFGVSTYEGYYFRVENDLTFTDYSGLGIGASICQFAGTFDGNGHKLLGINASIGRGGMDFALFQYIAPTATVKNVIIESPSLSSAGDALNCSFVVSHNNGRVENCHVTNAEINLKSASQSNQNGGVVAYLTKTGVVKGCSFSGKVITGCKFGSVVGVNYGGLVEGCESSADIVITRGNTYVGGISASGSGYQDSPEFNFKDCSFKGSIKILSASITSTITAGICAENTNTVISGCANEGKIVALNYNGGIAGWLFTGCKIKDCRNSGIVSDIFMERDSTNVTYNMSSYQGGIVGYGQEGTLERCFNSGTVRSFKGAGGILGMAESVTITDSYNAGLIDAPFTWLSGNEIVEMCGGLVGYKSGVETLILEMKNCLSLGTINNSAAARSPYSEYLGRILGSNAIKLTNCHYDSQVAGWGPGGLGAMTTAELTSGQAIEGFSSDIWQFTEGMYPRLNASAASDAAIAGASPLFLAAGNNHSCITADLTLGMPQDVAWNIVSGQGAVIDAAKVNITRGSLPETVILASTAGTATRLNMLSIYPNMFTGSGTESDPYLIATYEDMKTFSKVTTEGGLTFAGEYLKLVNDIDMNNDATFGCMNLDMAAPFAGTFDGNGHSLLNWNLNNHNTKTAYGGLFGYVAASGVIKNLVIGKTCSVGLYQYGGTIAARLFGTIENCKVLPSTLSSAAASGYWGGIAGQVDASGVISDCYVASDITLSGASNQVGGIAYSNSGLIQGCQYAGSLTGTAANNLAGICASNSGVIDNCLSSGVITAQHTVGGLTANNLGELKSCVVTAAVAYTAEVDLAGAVTGKNSGKMENVVYDSQISLLNNIEADGLTGKLTREIIAGQYGEKWTANGSTYPQLTKFAGEDAALLCSFPVIFPDDQTRITIENGAATCFTATGLTWRLEDSDDFTLRSNSLTFDGYTSYCYDYLKQTYAGITRQMRIGAYGTPFTGSGTEADPWIIATETDLRKLASETGKSYNQGDYAGKHFKITGDISLTAAFLGISCGNAKKFNGIIHGEGHKISNLNITGSAQRVGLVGYLGNLGAIENLTIESGAITNTQNYTGGFAGVSSGSISNCMNRATVTGSAQYTGGIAGYVVNPCKFTGLKNYGDVTGSNFYTGGIAGQLWGESESPYSGYENHGSVKGTMHAGGIFGWVLAPSLSDMKNYGEVSPATTSTCNMHGGIIGTSDVCKTIDRAVNYGKVSGSTTGVAGIIGRYWPSKDTASELTVTNCLNAGEVSGKGSYVGGVVGMAEAYTLKVSDCINVAAISNTAANLAAGTPGAGGIVGGGTPTISNSFNSGIITGSNCIGGILGRVPNNSATATITDCTNTGWLDGYGEKSANIGSISGYYSDGSAYTNCVYDKQMSNVGAVAGTDREGAEGKLTAALAPKGTYKVPSAFSDAPEVILASVPVFFSDEDTRYNVTGPFTVGASKSVEWTVESPLTIEGSNVTINAPTAEGDFNITASLGELTRVIPIHLDYDGKSNVNETFIETTAIQIVEGGIILPAGEYAVYTLSGICVANGSASGNSLVSLPAGLYVATSNGRAVKVNIR